MQLMENSERSTSHKMDIVASVKGVEGLVTLSIT